MNTKPTFTGGCYCGEVRYQGEGPPLMRGLCYCLTCQKEGPQLVTWTSEMQKFHFHPADVPAHPEFPKRAT